MLANAKTMLPSLIGELYHGVLGIFRPKTTKCSGGPAIRGLQRGGVCQRSCRVDRVFMLLFSVVLRRALD